jgi:Fe-S cluster biogenesis protein NfuA
MTNEKQNNNDDLVKINAIIDEHIRPFLQRDGGDLQVLAYADKTLKIFYQGACGSCPHAALGTLMAIQRVLREKFDPEIVVEIG